MAKEATYKDSDGNIISDDVIDAAYNFVDAMVTRADAWNGAAPLWHGWAIREAFLAGVKFQTKEKEGK